MTLSDYDLALHRIKRHKWTISDARICRYDLLPLIEKLRISDRDKEITKNVLNGANYTEEGRRVGLSSERVSGIFCNAVSKVRSFVGADESEHDVLPLSTRAQTFLKLHNLKTRSDVLQWWQQHGDRGFLNAGNVGKKTMREIKAAFDIPSAKPASQHIPILMERFSELEKNYTKLRRVLEKQRTSLHRLQNSITALEEYISAREKRP